MFHSVEDALMWELPKSSIPHSCHFQRDGGCERCGWRASGGKNFRLPPRAYHCPVPMVNWTGTILQKHYGTWVIILIQLCCCWIRINAAVFHSLLHSRHQCVSAGNAFHSVFSHTVYQIISLMPALNAKSLRQSEAKWFNKSQEEPRTAKNGNPSSGIRKGWWEKGEAFYEVGSRLSRQNIAASILSKTNRCRIPIVY